MTSLHRILMALDRRVHRLGARVCASRGRHVWRYGGDRYSPQPGSVRTCERCGAWSVYDLRSWDPPQPRDY